MVAIYQITTQFGLNELLYLMSQIKTKASNESVTDLLDSIEHPSRKAADFLLLTIFKAETD